MSLCGDFARSSTFRDETALQPWADEAEASQIPELKRFVKRLRLGQHPPQPPGPARWRSRPRSGLESRCYRVARKVGHAAAPADVGRAFDPTPEWYCHRRNWPIYDHPRSRPLPAHSLFADVGVWRKREVVSLAKGKAHGVCSERSKNTFEEERI